MTNNHIDNCVVGGWGGGFEGSHSSWYFFNSLTIIKIQMIISNPINNCYYGLEILETIIIIRPNKIIVVCSGDGKTVLSYCVTWQSLFV